jgi:hypothetical protein
MNPPSRKSPHKSSSPAGATTGLKEAAPKKSVETQAELFVKLTTVNAVVAAVVVLVAIVAFSSVMFKSHFDNPNITLVEEPLAKNAEFQLKPGEQYVYGYLFNDTQLNATYQILNGNNCTIIALMDADPPATSCVDRWGMDSRGYNSLLENAQMMPFKPWMLALHEGWKWNTSMYMNFENELHYVSSMDYRVMRTDTWHGRKAFVVMENLSDSGPQYEWVDSEKRILLMVQGDGYEVDLLEGLPMDNASVKD